MWKGEVVSIHLAAAGSGPMTTVDTVRAVEGRGLEGDRYFTGEGTYSDRPGPDREVTLIEREALDALQSESGVVLPPAESRRNILTRGVSLNYLVGKEFTVGEVRLRGIRLCEPCAHLVKLTEKPEVLPGLVHRGGLRATIVSGGTLRAGDLIEEAE